MTRSSATNRGQDLNAETFAKRERDWRNGAIVYQVLVDRFAPSARLDAKRELYPPPKVLRDWAELPKPGSYLADAQPINTLAWYPRPRRRRQ